METTKVVQRLWPLHFFRRRGHVDHVEFDPHDFQPALKTQLLILQPTPFCNLDCSYCYLPDRKNRARMEPDTARKAARRLAEDQLLDESLTVVWHAGEPLVLPVAYYEKMVAALSETIGGQCHITHSFQTNGTLISDAWCEFFTRHGCQVGISIDGPAALHDIHRRTRSGHATHAAVMRGLAALQRHGVEHHAICVVTAAALEQADAIHAFFTAQGVRDVGFNFDEAEGPHAESSLEGREDRHCAFLARMLAHMSNTGTPFQVRELAYAFRVISQNIPAYRWRGQELPYNSQTVPFSMVGVGWNGNFSTFSPELLGQTSAEYLNFTLGNVHSKGYLEAARGEAFSRLWDAVRRGVDRCAHACAYFDYCGGGSPVNKLYENGSMDSTETLYCRSMIQRPLDVALEAIESMPNDTPRT